MERWQPLRETEGVNNKGVGRRVYRPTYTFSPPKHTRHACLFPWPCCCETCTPPFPILQACRGLLPCAMARPGIPSGPRRCGGAAGPRAVLPTGALVPRDGHQRAAHAAPGHTGALHQAAGGGGLTVKPGGKATWDPKPHDLRGHPRLGVGWTASDHAYHPHCFHT